MSSARNVINNTSQILCTWVLEYWDSSRKLFWAPKTKSKFSHDFVEVWLEGFDTGFHGTAPPSIYCLPQLRSLNERCLAPSQWDTKTFPRPFTLSAPLCWNELLTSIWSALTITRSSWRHFFSSTSLLHTLKPMQLHQCFSSLNLCSCLFPNLAI